MRGVVTAADSEYFRPLQCLVTSLAGNSPATSVVVTDLGLTDTQGEWLRRRGVTVKPKPHDCLLAVPVGHELWQIWNKPVWMAYSGLDQCLWLDADCVILRPLDAILDELAANGSFAVRHTYDTAYPLPNDPSLYELFPVLHEIPYPPNNGVVGLDPDRDADLLMQWTRMCHEGTVGRARQLVTWQDEGALIWALRKRDYGHRVLDRPGWNRIVGTDDPASTDMHTWLDTEVAKWHAREPETIVLHFSQCKFWLKWVTGL